MNFSHAIFYQLNEGSGTTVSDALGKGPTGTVTGTTTGIWANADCLTVNNAQGASGNNAIKLQNAYIDELCNLSTLANQSLVVMFWFNQPMLVTSGTPFVFTYGKLLKGSPSSGAFGIAGDNDFSINYTTPNGATLINRGATMMSELGSSLDPGWNDVPENKWYAISMQFDVFDGKCFVHSCVNGRPQRGVRMFEFETAGFPRDDSIGTKVGIQLLAASDNNGAGIGNLWGQTRVKRVFVGRTSGEARNMIPKWAHSFFENKTGILDWMIT